MSEENKIIEKEIENENKEVESNQESISDEAMSNIKIVLLGLMLFW